MNSGTERQALPAALLIAFGLFADSLTLGRPLASFDERFILVGAERVQHGEVPYRDFRALEPPGQYDAVAGRFAPWC